MSFMKRQTSAKLPDSGRVVRYFGEMAATVGNSGIFFLYLLGCLLDYKPG